MQRSSGRDIMLRLSTTSGWGPPLLDGWSELDFHQLPVVVFVDRFSAHAGCSKLPHAPYNLYLTPLWTLRFRQAPNRGLLVTHKDHEP